MFLVTEGDVKGTHWVCVTEIHVLQQLASIAQETIQNLKEDTGSEVPKVCERSQEVRERWKQKLKEGFKREDIKCSTCGRVSIPTVQTFS